MSLECFLWGTSGRSKFSCVQFLWGYLSSLWFLKGNVAWYRFLGWQFFFLSISNMASPWLLASMVSDEKWAARLLEDPFHTTACHFSPVAFKVFSLSLSSHSWVRDDGVVRWRKSSDFGIRQTWVLIPHESMSNWSFHVWYEYNNI